MADIKETITTWVTNTFTLMTLLVSIILALGATVLVYYSYVSLADKVVLLIFVIFSIVFLILAKVFLVGVNYVSTKRKSKVKK